MSRLGVALVLSAITLVVQLIGAILSSSLSLLADSVHVLGDVASLGLAMFAAGLAGAGPSTKRTFGWQRAEILAAAVNAVILLLASVWIVVQSVRRLLNGAETVEPKIMLIFAAVGLIANAIAMSILHKGSHHSANVRGAFLHVVADFAGSCAVVVSAIAILIWPTVPFDAVAAMFIALLIAPRAWTLLRETTDVLLEAVPKDVDMETVLGHMMSVESVVDVHDLHAWLINSGKPVLSAHVVVEDNADHERILDALGQCLAGHFDISHCTFQLESRAHRDHENLTENF